MPCMPRATKELELAGGPAQGKSVYCRRLTLPSHCEPTWRAYWMQIFGTAHLLRDNFGGMTSICMPWPDTVTPPSIEPSRTVTIGLSP